MLLGLLVLSSALAGYGDAVSGMPRYVERDLHLWTNAARVDPLAFEEQYVLGGCSLDGFSEAERTPRAPLAWSPDLQAAARAHTEDMAANDFLEHESFDGTSFEDRLADYYPSSQVGENIAAGEIRPEFAVLRLWMCSTQGHRGNIMAPAWEELGASLVDAYATQDFGARGGTAPKMAMGLHFPQDPGPSVGFYVDVSDGVAPEVVAVVLDGIPRPMALEWGSEIQGIWFGAVELPSGDTACHTYWFRALHGGVEARFPEEGSYGWGACAWDDEAARWLDDQDLLGEDSRDGCTCTSGGAPVLAVGWLLAGLVALRRRR